MKKWVGVFSIDKLYKAFQAMFKVAYWEIGNNEVIYQTGNTNIYF